MRPVAVFVVVILGAAIAGILGAIFAIPVAAAILAVTDYLRQRDVLLRADDEGDATEAGEASGSPVAKAGPDGHDPDTDRPTVASA